MSGAINPQITQISQIANQKFAVGSFCVICVICGFRFSHEMSRAIRNAAPAATLPISAVCKALRVGRVPV